MIITVEARDQYGTTRYYPTDPAIAKAYTGLTGHKTLLIADKDDLKAFGVEIEIVPPVNPFE
jgi:hypothetical protein